MANATTSVVTTTGGSPELVIDGETGYIVKTSDAKAFADAMNKLISSKEKCMEMGQKAQGRLDNDFSAKETVKQHLAYFSGLTKDKS
jgi:glycosyltransferase involved in cell wall biosynthesis